MYDYPLLIHLLNTSKHPAANFPKTEALALSKVSKLISFTHPHTHPHTHTPKKKKKCGMLQTTTTKYFQKVKSSSSLANFVNCFSKSNMALTENSTCGKWSQFILALKEIKKGEGCVSEVCSRNSNFPDQVLKILERRLPFYCGSKWRSALWGQQASQ